MFPLSSSKFIQNARMSGAGPRENVFATRMALTNVKLRLKSADTGHKLLSKKRDALTMRFRAILKKVDEVRRARYTRCRPSRLTRDPPSRPNERWDE